jgi:prophage antirepressor-like protein
MADSSVRPAAGRIQVMTEPNLFGSGGIDPHANAGILYHAPTGRPLRWVRLDDAVWFHFGDLCKGAGYSNTSAAIDLVGVEDKRKIDIWSVSAGPATLSFLRAGAAGANAETWFVTENGFFTLDLAAPRRDDGPGMFRRWVMSVVFPRFRCARAR